MQYKYVSKPSTGTALKGMFAVAFVCALLLTQGVKADSPGRDSLNQVIRFSKSTIARANAYVELSEIAYISNIDSVIPLCQSALQILDSDRADSSKAAKLRILDIKAHALNNIGSVFYSKDDLPKALDYYLQGLKMREQLNDKVGLAESYNNLGVLYKRQNDTNMAIVYYQKSLGYYREVYNAEGQAVSLGNIGTLYASENKNDTALSYFLKESKIEDSVGDKYGMARVLADIGTIYQKQGKLEEALDCSRKSLALALEIDNKDDQARTLNIMAQVEYDKNNLELADEYGTKSLNIYRELAFPIDVMHGAKLMYQVYDAQKRWKEALDMHVLFAEMLDTVNNEEMHKQLIQKELQNEYDKKETELKAEQERKNIIARAESKRQKIAILLTIIIALSAGTIAILVFRSLKATRRQKVIIEEQKLLVEQKNKDITDSIIYAKRLQDAILPPVGLILKYLPDSFILYKPKDIVAGDFYWFASLPSSGTLIAACDCTGHGVPGAMVSVVCSNAMNRAVKEFGITEPGKILDKVRELVLETFSIRNQEEKSENHVQDGMDISLCSIQRSVVSSQDKDMRRGMPSPHGEGQVRVQWAGAYNPLWYLQNGEIQELNPDKQPIGKTDNPKPFTTHTITFPPSAGGENVLYLFTDGFADQFGGPKDKKFKDARLHELIRSIAGKPMKEQKEQMEAAFENWKGARMQTDDVCVIGIRV